jgi:hypothetical protein
MAIKNYDSDQYTVSFAGIPIHGYADGPFLTIEMVGDQFTDVIGTDGEIARSKTNEQRATATIRLLQTSDSNDLLSAVLNLDLKTPNGAGVGVFTVRDNQGRTILNAGEAWITKIPSVELDRGATEREWTFRLAKLEAFIGGN